MSKIGRADCGSRALGWRQNIADCGECEEDQGRDGLAWKVAHGEMRKECAEPVECDAGIRPFAQRGPLCIEKHRHGQQLSHAKDRTQILRIAELSQDGERALCVRDVESAAGDQPRRQQAREQPIRNLSVDANPLALPLWPLRTSRFPRFACTNQTYK